MTSPEADEPRSPYPKPYADTPLDQDPFVRGLKQRLPEHLRDSFNEEQLAALRGVFGARSWVRHRVDLRGTVRLPGSKSLTNRHLEHPSERPVEPLAGDVVTWPAPAAMRLSTCGASAWLSVLTRA